RYPLAWGSQEVAADAFVTGTAGISSDLTTITVTLYIFDRTENKFAPLGEDFTAPVPAGQLSEMGESFTLRGAFDEEEPKAREEKQRQAAVQTARQVKEQQAPHPLQAANPPVALEVRYDGRSVPIEFRNGKAAVPEPQQGQKVELLLKRDASRERYGV